MADHILKIYLPRSLPWILFLCFKSCFSKLLRVAPKSGVSHKAAGQIALTRLIHKLAQTVKNRSREDFMTGRKLVVVAFIFCIGIVMLCLFPSISNAEATVTVQVGSPKILVSPKSVNFGSIGIGSTSDTKIITITGKGYLTVNSITLTGVNASEFNQTNDCSSIPPDGSCTINATFNPTSSSGKKSATISIFSNDPKKPTVNVKLSGQAAPKISVEGTWDVHGKMKVKVSFQGQSETAVDNAPDQFTFFNDGSFEMIDMDGTWSQQGSTFVINLDPDSISSYFEDGFSGELGLDVSVDVINMSFTGKVQKNGTIKGSFKFSMNFDIEDYDDLQGTVTASANYTGTRIATSSSSSVKKQERSELTESILNMIKEELNNAVQPPDNMPLLK
jgi:hypothetical protein